MLFTARFAKRITAGTGALAIVLAFQNCGPSFVGGASSGDSIQSSVFGSNANLRGASKNLVRSSNQPSVAVGSANASGITPLVTCNANQTTCEATGMPLVSQMNVSTPDANMWCAPTAATMLFSAIAKTDFTPFTTGSSEYYAATLLSMSGDLDRALYVGQKMETTSNGTYPYKQSSAIANFLADNRTQYQMQFTNVLTLTPQAVVDVVRAGGLAAINYAHTTMEVTTLASGKKVARATVNGGHAIALSGFEMDSAGNINIAYNDPGDATRYVRNMSAKPRVWADGTEAVYPYQQADGSSTLNFFEWGFGSTVGLEIASSYFPIQRNGAALVVPSAPSIPVVVIPTPTPKPSTVPTATPQPTTSATYAYSASAWGSCSASCGGGSQTRSVSCLSNLGVSVATSFCAGGTPIQTQACNVNACQEQLSLSRQNWLNALYANGLNRSIDSAGLTGWTARMLAAKSVDQCKQIVRDFTGSPEFQTRAANQTASDSVITAYLTTLLRNPLASGDQAGYQNWLNQLNAGIYTRASMVDSMISTPEMEQVCIGLGYRN